MSTKTLRQSTLESRIHQLEDDMDEVIDRLDGDIDIDVEERKCLTQQYSAMNDLMCALNRCAKRYGSNCHGDTYLDRCKKH